MVPLRRFLWTLCPALVPACFISIDAIQGPGGDAPDGVQGGATADSSGGAEGSGAEGGAPGGFAGSGSNPVEGSGGAGTGGEQVVVPENLALLDDLEDGDGQIIQVDARSGAWVTFNDPSATGTLNHSNRPTPEQLEPPRGDSEFAMHIVGSGFTEWGAGIAFGFYDPGAPYDLRGYSGVRFWIRGSATAMRLGVPLSATTLIEEGGTCTVECGDNYSTSVTVTNTWRQVSVPFSDLMQPDDFGSPDPLILSSVMQIQFFFEENQSFDVWIDDIEVYTDED